MMLDNTIFIDTKEKNEQLYEDLVWHVSTTPQLYGLTTKRQGLYCGDLKFRNLGAERKTIDDFIASIKDARIFKQAFKMSQNYEFCYVLISGMIEDQNPSRIQGIYTTIADIECRYGFKAMFFPNDEMLIHYFTILCAKLMKDLKPKFVFEKKQIDSTDEQICVIEGVYGVGRKTAKNLLSHFTTVKNVINASESEFSEIEGIGKKTAKHLFDIFNKKFK
jgi:Fanconi anemia group M protein